jgi:hypothetical protein
MQGIRGAHMIKTPVKIFSLFQQNLYNKIFADVPVISELDVAYPFYVYSVLLPVGESEKTLNLFEETVLKMTDIVSGKSDLIAETLCLSTDFVTFIQNKLKNTGFVDERYSITESGKSILTLGNKTEKIEYVPVKIFVDPKTQGKISYVHSGEFSAEAFSPAEHGYLRFNVGTEGRPEYRKALTINPFKDKRPSLLPSELETIVRRYNRIRKNNNCSFRGLYHAFNEKADISDAPELFYVHLKLAIPDGNAEKIIISDGFSIDIDFLLSGINENPKAISDLKRLNVKEEERKSVKQKATESKYDELYHHWNGKDGVNSICGELRNLTRDSSDSKKKFAEKYAVFARKTYGALEWCLYYALKEQASFSELIASFSSTSPRTNQLRLITAANSIGINVSEHNKILLSISNIGVNNMAAGIPDMFSCIALMLISENNANIQEADRIFKDYISGICDDANKNDALKNESFVLQSNDIIDFIADLKRMRDATSHGIDENEIPPFSDLADIYEIVRKTIPVILPAFTVALENDVNRVVGNVSQERIRAIYALEKEWGVVEFRTISPEIREMLIRLEFIREEFNDSRSGEYVIQMSKIAEFSLSRTIKEIKRDYDDEFEMKETAFARIKKCSGENLNVAIVRVQDRFIRLALRGSTKSTLGAYMIAYFAYAGDDDFDKVNSACNNSFVQTLVKIITLRGHANKLFIKASLEELDRLRENLIKIVSSL